MPPTLYEKATKTLTDYAYAVDEKYAVKEKYGTAKDYTVRGCAGHLTRSSRTESDVGRGRVSASRKNREELPRRVSRKRRHNKNNRSRPTRPRRPR